MITRARQIRRSPDAGDNKFNLYSAVSAGWPRDVAAAGEFFDPEARRDEAEPEEGAASEK